MDRGMIKWKPFYPIKGQDKIKKNILKEKSMISKPIILEDLENEINNNLIYAYNNNISVNIKYWHFGFLKSIEGKIKKIDLIEKYIIINNVTLFLKNILKIELVLCYN